MRPARAARAWALPSRSAFRPAINASRSRRARSARLIAPAAGASPSFGAAAGACIDGAAERINAVATMAHDPPMRVGRWPLEMKDA